jgi:hypothetical protein
MSPELRISAVSARLDDVLDCLQLASMEGLDGCTSLLEHACRELAGISVEHSAPPGAALAAAKQLRSKIRQARRLLDNIYRFHAGWARSAGWRTVGYLPGGHAAPMRGASRWCLRG